jgi:hypothetical protein
VKTRHAFVLALAVAVLSGQSCPPPDIHFNKATGGGWFLDTLTGNRITFGFTAQPLEEPVGEINAKGKFQLIDHGDKTKVHGTFYATIGTTSNFISMFFGTCLVNREDGYLYGIQVEDLGEPGPSAGDYIIIGISHISDPENPLYEYMGYLEGGNIQVHAEKE